MQNIFTTSDGTQIPVFIETRWGMRNITLRPCVRPTYEIRMSVPKLTPKSAALNFLESKRKWVEKVFASAPKKVSVKSGDIINFLGRDVLIKHDAGARAGVYMEYGGPAQSATAGDYSVPGVATMIVCGPPEMLERRVRDEIKDQFLAELKRQIASVPPEFSPKRLRVTDTTSRWGSCSSTGTMSFSYRLAFAPPEIMRYVIMHELAHTKHMDHSPAFWATVAELYGDGVGRAKLWLSHNGAALHKYF